MHIPLHCWCLVKKKQSVLMGNLPSPMTLLQTLYINNPGVGAKNQTLTLAINRSENLGEKTGKKKKKKLGEKNRTERIQEIGV